LSLPVLVNVVGEETPWKGRSLKGFYTDPVPV
jgi:hypothetical protein